MNDIRIVCATCKKLVDSYRVWDDPNVRLMHVTVWCHGQTEHCEIHYDFLADAGRPLTHGVAFVPKPNAVEHLPAV